MSGASRDLVSAFRTASKGRFVKPILAVFVWALVAIAPAGAQQAGGMSAMSYYVGTWTCVGGPVGTPPANASVTAVMNGAVLNSSVSIPVQPGIKMAYYVTFATSYDGKGRYIQTTLDSYGSWSVSNAPTWTGNTEQWTDLTTSDGKPGHGEAVRTDNDHYTYTGYGTPTGTTPNFKITCQRQSS
jgi:hypothetical protein